MPWCDTCTKFFNPGAMAPGGSCPDCGRTLDTGDLVTHVNAVDDVVAAKVPWHFWVAVVAMVIYLGWRLVQGIVWAVT